MAAYRVFRCQILTLSKVWGQHTEAPWNSTHAHMFSFFLASRFEIVKWIFRFSLPGPWGSHFSCSICKFGVARACVAPENNAKSLHWSSKDHNGRVWAMVRTKMTSNTHMPQLEMWPPDTRWTPNLKIHFPISNIDARKKLNVWAHAEFQGASVCWPQILLNVNIWQRKIRCPAIFLWFQLSRGVCSW